MAPNCSGTTEMDYTALPDKLALLEVRDKEVLLEKINLLLQAPEECQSSAKPAQP